MNRKLVGPQGWSVCVGEEEDILRFSASTPARPSLLAIFFHVVRKEL
jgi:hypothetical protein